MSFFAKRGLRDCRVCVHMIDANGLFALRLPSTVPFLITRRVPSGVSLAS